MLVVAPAAAALVALGEAFDDLNKDLAGFEGIYSYFQGRMVIFNTQNKSFEAFGVIGDEIKRSAAVRCP